MLTMKPVKHNVDLEQHAYHLLSKAFLLLDDYDRHFFAEYGLSTRQFWALQHLSEHHGCSMVDLSRAVHTDKSNITSIIDRLERLNLVTRTVDSRDRRSILITLTPEGSALRDQMKKQHDTRVQELLEFMSKSDLSLFVEHLQEICNRIASSLAQTVNKRETS